MASPQSMGSISKDDVLVGIDASPAGDAAIDYATAQAARLGARLHLVHAFAWPYLHVPTGASDDALPGAGLRSQAERTVAAGRKRALAAANRLGAGHVEIRTDLVDGFPAPVLINGSRHAALVVIGNRGLGGFTGLLLGSTASQLIAHAYCPVVVVRGRPDPTGDITVGVDGSPASRAAVRYACTEAERMGCSVDAVTVWSHPKPHEPGDMMTLLYEPAALERESITMLRDAVAGPAAEHPSVTVHESAIRGRTRRTLIDASTKARLMVVGRHKGAFGTVGSVALALAHHADCPVVVVPPPR